MCIQLGSYTRCIYIPSLADNCEILARSLKFKNEIQEEKNSLEKCLWATHQREITLNYARQLLKLCHKRIAILIEDLFRNRLKTTNFIDGFFLLSISCYLSFSLSLFLSFLPNRSAIGFDTFAKCKNTSHMKASLQVTYLNRAFRCA